jgi:hypothetical protein
MHDHISSHDLLHPLNTPLLSWVTNNGPTRVKNTKCSLHIFPANLLFFRKPCISPQWDYDVSLQKHTTPDRYHYLSNNPWCIYGP